MLTIYYLLLLIFLMWWCHREPWLYVDDVYICAFLMDYLDCVLSGILILIYRESWLTVTVRFIPSAVLVWLCLLSECICCIGLILSNCYSLFHSKCCVGLTVLIVPLSTCNVYMCILTTSNMCWTGSWYSDNHTEHWSYTVTGHYIDIL